MHSPIRGHRLLATTWTALALALVATGTRAQDLTPPQVKRLQEEKPLYAKRQQAMLALRYDLADRPARGVTMSRGKPVQDGVRVRPGDGMTWDQLAALPPEAIKARNLWPAGFLPLPHPHHEAGGMVFPRVLIAETRRQTGRDLTRFDLDFDLPDHLLPEFPAPLYLTTRADLGDVSRGHLVTLGNYRALFGDILNPTQLDGLRLLVTPLPQQPFSSTGDRLHNLRVDRSFKEVTINGRRASADGPIKTLPLRGIEDSPPYLHDDRLLTLDDTVEDFNLVLELKLTALEQRQLAAFLRVL